MPKTELDLDHAVNLAHALLNHFCAKRREHANTIYMFLPFIREDESDKFPKEFILLATEAIRTSFQDMKLLEEKIEHYEQLLEAANESE